jgi:hypothetical protein
VVFHLASTLDYSGRLHDQTCLSKIVRHRIHMRNDGLVCQVDIVDINGFESRL